MANASDIFAQWLVSDSALPILRTSLILEMSITFLDESNFMSWLRTCALPSFIAWRKSEIGIISSKAHWRAASSISNLLPCGRIYFLKKFVCNESVEWSESVETKPTLNLFPSSFEMSSANSTSFFGISSECISVFSLLAPIDFKLIQTQGISLSSGCNWKA